MISSSWQCMSELSAIKREMLRVFICGEVSNYEVNLGRNNDIGFLLSLGSCYRCLHHNLLWPCDEG